MTFTKSAIDAMRRGLEREVGEAQDNLARYRASGHKHDDMTPNGPWGEWADGWQKRLDTAKKALAEIDAA